MAQQPQRAEASSLSRIYDHTQLNKPHSVGPPGRVISPTQRPLPTNTQHSQQTSITGGIRTQNPSQWDTARQLRPALGKLSDYYTARTTELSFLAGGGFTSPPQRSDRRRVGYLADLGGQKSIFENSTELEHKGTWQRRIMPEQKATLTEPLRATPPPYG
jgi:hypothetical protein